MRELKRNDKVTYEKELNFGKIEVVKATVMMIKGNFALLDSGDTVPKLIKN
tara:strand:+ start:607 stop:759 length:153 start_codon:yes stop_codon:yes gene_type:complete